MSEEIALALADLDHLADLRARCQLLEIREADAVRRAEAAEADAAALLERIEAFIGAESALASEPHFKTAKALELDQAHLRLITALTSAPSGAALLAKLRAAEDAYDRLLGAFELHMDILECQQALADYAGIFYDACLGALAGRTMEQEALP